MTDQRELDKSFMRKIMQWDTVNRFKRNSDLERAAIAKQSGVDAAELPGFGQEVPWGNNTVINQSSSGSSLGKVVSVAALTLIAGALGYGASTLQSPSVPVEIPPVDAVLEWEITPDGDTRIRSIRGEEFGVLESESVEIIRDVE